MSTHQLKTQDKMPAKELKKGGKPAQVKGACDVALDENKEFLRAFFSGEPAEVAVGLVVKTMGVEHEKRQASAGLRSGRGCGTFQGVSVSFGTDTDYVLETADGGLVVVPQRFLNHRGDVHQNLFKVGDVILTAVGSCEKHVNIGSRLGQMAVGGRGWHEVRAWIPAEKVARAIKEGRLRDPSLKADCLVDHEARAAAEAAGQAAAEAAAQAERAALRAMDAKAAAGGGGGGSAAASGEADEEDLGTWY